MTYEVDYTVHLSIAIGAPPASIWPYIIDSNQWTGVPLIHCDGPKDEVGETFAVGDIAEFFAKNIELAPNERRTFKLYDKSGSRHGYVSWSLKGIDGQSIVSYDIYFQKRLSVEDIQPSGGFITTTQLQKDVQGTSQRQSQAQLLALKNLVELKL